MSIVSKFGGSGLPHGPGPGSYTHLDVYKRQGYGKALLCELASLAKRQGCGRLEWWCLDWNQPSIDFYQAMGAEAMSEWTVYRVAGKQLEQLAAQADPIKRRNC